MSLTYGTKDAPEGMTASIYNELMQAFAADLVNMGVDSAAVEEGFKKLSFAVAKGVVEHIKSNMRIKGITTKGGELTKATSDAPNTGTTHTHKVPLKDVVFTQNNDGTGHVE